MGVILLLVCSFALRFVPMFSWKRNHNINDDSRKWRAFWYRYLYRNDTGQREEEGAPCSGCPRKPLELVASWRAWLCLQLFLSHVRRSEANPSQHRQETRSFARGCAFLHSGLAHVVWCTLGSCSLAGRCLFEGYKRRRNLTTLGGCVHPRVNSKVTAQRKSCFVVLWESFCAERS